MRIRKLPTGTNSEVYQVRAPTGEMFCLKQYKSRPGDLRDRLDTEFTALQFLWKNGIESIPKPIARDSRVHSGTYSYVNGQTLRGRAVSTNELSQAMRFLASLHGLRLRSGARQFGRASEACFSFDEYCESIDARRARLSRAGEGSALGQWLTLEWDPAWNRGKALVKKSARGAGLSLSTSLDAAYRTLSPSDFGFHNAIRDERGRLVFVDFEYFGWDDPAKLIVDFILHPGMKLTGGQKRWFVSHATAIYTEEPTLGKRLPLVSVLLGFKWCLILLNCFLDAPGREDPLWQRNCMTQLLKARRLYDRMKNYEAP